MALLTFSKAPQEGLSRQTALENTQRGKASAREAMSNPGNHFKRSCIAKLTLNYSVPVAPGVVGFFHKELLNSAA